MTLYFRAGYFLAPCTAPFTHLPPLSPAPHPRPRSRRLKDARSGEVRLWAAPAQHAEAALYEAVVAAAHELFHIPAAAALCVLARFRVSALPRVRRILTARNPLTRPCRRITTLDADGDYITVATAQELHDAIAAQLSLGRVTAMVRRGRSASSLLAPRTIAYFFPPSPPALPQFHVTIQDLSAPSRAPAAAAAAHRAPAAAAHDDDASSCSSKGSHGRHGHGHGGRPSHCGPQVHAAWAAHAGHPHPPAWAPKGNGCRQAWWPGRHHHHLKMLMHAWKAHRGWKAQHGCW